MQLKATFVKDKRWLTLIADLNSFVCYDLCQAEAGSVYHNFSPFHYQQHRQFSLSIRVY